MTYWKASPPVAPISYTVVNVSNTGKATSSVTSIGTGAFGTSVFGNGLFGVGNKVRFSA